jgi:hypothetical protein
MGHVPRRRPRSSPRAFEPRPLLGGHQRVESWPDGEWNVRNVTGSAATKPYRCPGCNQLIPPATPHLVAWPAEPPSYGAPEGLDARRHWHTACWQARGRRGPR